MHPYVEAQAASELALLALAVRGYLAREHADEPEVVSLRLAASIEDSAICGVFVEVELIDAAGMAVGGLTL